MTQGRKKVEVGTPLLGNDKNIVIVNYLSYFFLLKLSELNGYLKGYLKPRINKLPKKKNFSLSKYRFIKDMSFIFFDKYS